jgi:hypothetical protein
MRGDRIRDVYRDYYAEGVEAPVGAPAFQTRTGYGGNQRYGMFERARCPAYFIVSDSFVFHPPFRNFSRSSTGSSGQKRRERENDAVTVETTGDAGDDSGRRMNPRFRKEREDDD